MFEGQVLTMKGKGAAAKRKDGQSGDLLLSFEVQPHPVFRRIAYDVHVNKTISFLDAALGSKVRYGTEIDSASFYFMSETAASQFCLWQKMYL